MPQISTFMYSIEALHCNVAEPCVLTAVCTCVNMSVLLQYRERIIFLGKAIDEELGNQLVATMLYLDSENKKDIQLYINCSGGDVRALQGPPSKLPHMGSHVLGRSVCVHQVAPVPHPQLQDGQETGESMHCAASSIVCTTCALKQNDAGLKQQRVCVLGQVALRRHARGESWAA
jgi:hypothetical protein